MPALNGDRGFTLIEVLIATALGVMLIMVAFAGLRAASSAYTTSNKLSIENSMLRAGFQAALEEIDFWRGVDNPDGVPMHLRRVWKKYPAGHPLEDGIGYPFTPMRAVWNDHSVWNQDRGEPVLWEPSAKEWSPHRFEAEFAGNMAECSDTDCRFGRYAIFSNLYSLVDIPLYTAHHMDEIPGGGIPAYGTVSLDKRGYWWSRQFRGLSSVLGYYGMVDYLPANTIDAFYSKVLNAVPAGDGGESMTSASGIPREWIRGGGGTNNWKLNPTYDGNSTPMSRYRATVSTSIAIVPNPVNAPDWHLGWEVRANHELLWSTNAPYVQRFLDLTQTESVAIPLRPSHWPMVQTSVRRFFGQGRFFNLCIVTMSNPVSGVRTQLSFNATGTSLRGARQQRGRDGGWAAPGQPTLDD